MAIMSKTGANEVTLVMTEREARALKVLVSEGAEGMLTASAQDRRGWFGDGMTALAGDRVAAAVRSFDLRG